MIVRIAIAFGVIMFTLLVAVLWRRREGRFTEGHGRFERTDLGLGRRDKPSAVLIEFFGEHCAPCKVVQARLNTIAAEVPDLAVISIDAGVRTDLAKRYNVGRVPTVFVANEDLRILWRASGVPSENAIRGALLGPDWAGRPHPGNAPTSEAAQPA